MATDLLQELIKAGIVQIIPVGEESLRAEEKEEKSE